MKTHYLFTAMSTFLALAVVVIYISIFLGAVDAQLDQLGCIESSLNPCKEF
jgi:hypothetical protein